MSRIAYFRIVASLPVVVRRLLVLFVAGCLSCRRRPTSALAALAAFLVWVAAADVGAQTIERDLGDITGKLGQTLNGTLNSGEGSHWYRFTVSKSDLRLVVNSEHRGTQHGIYDTDMCIYSDPVSPSALDGRAFGNCPGSGRHANGSTSSSAREYPLSAGAGIYYMRIIRGAGNRDDHYEDPPRYENRGRYDWTYWVSDPGVTLSPSDLTVNEGESDSYTVRITSVPQGTVTIMPQSSNDAVTVSPATLRFTSGNWTDPQTVTVTSKGDADTSGETATIEHRVANYGNITSGGEVKVTVIARPGVVIGQKDLNVPEGSSRTYTVVLKTPPTNAATVTVKNDNPDVSVMPQSLSFTSGNWQIPQTFTVTARQDDDSDNETVVIQHDVTGYGNVADGGRISVTVTDDDTPSVKISVSTLDVAENGSATYTVSLGSSPSETVTVTPQGDNPDIAISPGGLSFTSDNWRTPQTFTVTASQDDDGDDETATIRHVVTGYGGVTGGAVEVRISDTYRAGPDPKEKQVVEEIVDEVTAGVVSNVTANIGARFSSARGGGSAPSAGGGPAGLDSIAAALAQRYDRSRGAAAQIGYEAGEAPARLDFGRLATGGAFEIALGAAEGEAGGGLPGVTVWGRGDILFFDNDSLSANYDGNLKAGYLGADAWLSQRTLAGVAASRSQVEADYNLADPGPGETGAGKLKVTLTGAHPYLRYAHREDAEAWAVLGAGTGEIENRPADGRETETTDVTMLMAAAGLRGEIPTDGALDVAVLADAGFGRLKGDSGSGEIPRAIDSLSVNSWRLRAGAEVSRPETLENGGILKPFAEFAGRYDRGGGDADAGIEVSGGLLFADPASGFGIEARGRALALYSGGDYSEYGASVTVSLSPGTGDGGEGLSFSLAPRLGANSAAGDALWRDDPFALPGAEADRRHRALALGAAVGYGLPVGFPRGVATPFGEADFGAGGDRRFRSGVRFAGSGDPGAMSVELAGERSGFAGRAPEHRIVLVGRARF